MKKDFGKPIIAVANSFSEFVPGHVHLNKVGRIVSEAIKQAGGIPSRVQYYCCGMMVLQWVTWVCCIPSKPRYYCRRC